MLATQSWRIIRNPKSLLAGVLKETYFKDSNFLNAKIGNNPSYTWRSILWGPKLFKKGYRWKIVRGTSTYIKTLDSTLKVKKMLIRINRSFVVNRVCNILNDDGSWNVRIIKDCFIPADANSTLNIPYRGRDYEDESFGVKNQRVGFVTT